MANVYRQVNTYILVFSGFQCLQCWVLEDGLGLDDGRVAGGSEVCGGGVRGLGGGEGQGRALEVRGFLLLVDGVRQRRGLAAVAVQPDLVLSALRERIVYGEIRLALEDRHFDKFVPEVCA